MYVRQLHVLHSQFSDAPCAHTAREAAKPCTYNNSTSYTLNSLTHHASTQRERPQSPVLTTPRLPLSILRRTLRPHSEAKATSNPALYLPQLHVFCSQFSNATLRPHSGKGNPALCLRQRERQPSPASVAGKATQPYGNHSAASLAASICRIIASTQRERQPSPVSQAFGKGNPALPP